MLRTTGGQKPVSLGMLAIAMTGVLSLPKVLPAQTVPPGTIYHDALWSGGVTITSDVRITGATVRVEPGSAIRFIAPAPGASAPVIRLTGTPLTSGRPRTQARLVLAGTAEKPIIVETPAGNPPGVIAAGPMTGCSIVARHVIFRRLGKPVSARRSEPAVFLVLTSPDNDLWITDCRFEECGPVHAEFIGSGATAEITRCTFAGTVGQTALVLIGTGDGVRVVADNIADAAFRIECPQVLLRDNVLIGDSAAIAVPTTTGDGVAIIGNYVHCTTQLDSGHYALKCSTPNAVVSRNVLRGGTYVIESAPATVTGNVLVGVAGLQANFGLPGLDVEKLESTTTTHYLIANLPPSAVVADNLLLGPAYAALAVGSPAVQPRIENNFFDGWGIAPRAVHFNPPTRKPTDQPIAAVLRRNVIARYRSAPILDGARRIGTLAEVGHNLFAGVPDPPYEKTPDVPGLGGGDRRLDTFSQLRLKGPAATRSAGKLEDQLLRRQATVPEVRQAWLDAYQPDTQPTAASPDAPAGPRR